MIFVCIIRIDALWLVDCGGWYGAMMAVVEIIVVYISSMHLLKKYYWDYSPFFYSCCYCHRIIFDSPHLLYYSLLIIVQKTN